MRIYFVRHGIAEDLADSDFDRRLTPRGIRRVEASARVIRRLEINPARVYSSPRLRARQTAEIIADALGSNLSLAEEVNFGFDLADIRSLSRGLRTDDEVMFVGHNPDMSLAVRQLTGCAISMKKGGLARVDVAGKKAEDGELVWLIAPKVFDALDKQALALNEIEGIAATPAQKLPITAYPIHDLIRRRWSTVGFDRERNIDHPTLLSILEAARWSASSANLQPWRFIVAPRTNRMEFDKALSVLREGNQPWAQHAAVLMIAVTHRYPKPDYYHRHAAHDLGLAISQMVLQAQHLDVYTHQMAGFDPDKARDIYGIPAAFEPFTAIAFGYRAQATDHLPDRYREREAGGRERRALSETVFNGSWGRTADFLD